MDNLIVRSWVLVLPEDLPKSSSIIIYDPPKPKFIKATVVQVGSEVTNVKAGDKVVLFNEGAAWKETKQEMRLVRIEAIVYKLETDVEAIHTTETTHAAEKN